MNNYLKYILCLSPLTLGVLFSCSDNNTYASNNIEISVESSEATFLNTYTSTSIVVDCTVIITGTVTSTTTTTTTTTSEIIEDIIVTDIPSFKPIVIPDNALYIRNNIICFTYADAIQENVDMYDVVYATGYLTDEGTEFERIERAENLYPYTILFGHNYKSFSILPYLYVGELFYMNVNGEQITYEIQRSESGYDSNDLSTIYSYNDNIDMLRTDYGYDALILVTCYGDNRWVIVAKPVS